MGKRILLFILAFLVWGGLNWPMDAQHLIIGIMVAAFISILTADMFVQRPHFFLHPKRYLWFAYYCLVFIWECLKANIDVAFRVIHPDMPIHPGIVKVKTTIKSDTGLTFLANSITLTPGTLTVDIDKDESCLYIHWIEVRAKDVEGATQRIVKRFERILMEIFE
jgi:multicomponent Na+:H+ antiporter subunit E